MSNEVDSAIDPQLNERQRQAVEAVHGPVLVLAGAGSGKTRVLTHRIQHLIKNVKVRPQRILAVTFTNKATKEMKDRLAAMLGDDGKNLWVSTFHSACLRILRRHADQLGYGNDFQIYDDDDTRGAIKSVIKRLKIDDKKYPVQTFSRAIDRAKNAGLFPENFVQGKHYNQSANLDREIQGQVYEHYQRDLRAANAMDFGDLMLNAVELLTKHPTVLEFYQQLLQFILVDEFQDTNEIQYRLIKMLAAPQNNLFVVGDDDQSIYSFRGATVRNILEFDRDFPKATVIALEKNYRSTSNVLTAANAVISKNKSRHKKTLWTDEKDGPPIVSYIAPSEIEEAEFVVHQIKYHISEGSKLNDIAIFYRTNAQSRALEEVLMSHKITFKIFGGLRFYERKEVKDIVAYLRLIRNIKDNQAFLRVINTPPRGIGTQTVQGLVRTAEETGVSLFEAAKSNGSGNKKLTQFIGIIEFLQKSLQELYLGEFVQLVCESSEYITRLKTLGDEQSQSRLENLLELVGLARAFEQGEESHDETLTRFLDRIALASADEQPEGDKNATEFVSLMTLHLAKGLEFPIVFFTGLEEGLVPHYRSLYDPDALEEERRLCYVGITRARVHLYLSTAYSRGMFTGMDGYSGGYREPSRFLLDIPEEVLGAPVAFEHVNDVAKDQTYDEDAIDRSDWE